MQMTHGSLFSGIGGFDLAAEWMGWENKFHCEWNPFGQRVLKHYWPNAESFTDITKTDFTKYANKIDILTGGFPCQPYSSAGKRKGKEDERHLWPEMLRAIREISPRYVVGENVRGLTNWNGGLVFEEVCAELESYGYQVAPVIIPACGVNAPHRRERIWFVAYADESRHESRSQYSRYTKENDKGIVRSIETGNVAHTQSSNDNGKFGNMGSEKKENGTSWKEDTIAKPTCINTAGVITYATSSGRRQDNRHGESGLNDKKSSPSYWENFPTQSPVCSGDDGLPGGLDGITFPKWRNESIKAYGNAIVAQVAYSIFKALELCK